MKELALTRTPHDRHLYTLDSVGSIRLEGVLSKSATARVGDNIWHFTRRGIWRPSIEATDDTGAVVGEFTPRDLRRGGTLRWAGTEFALRPASALRERYALCARETELAVLDGKSWGKRPVTITLPGGDAVEPELLLFAAFVVHRLAANADSSTAAATAAVSASSSG
jgi:hypothetical protein